MIIHELAHLKVTYLGHGERMTPSRIRAANPRQQSSQRGGSGGQDRRHIVGESGEFFERGIYGGTIDYVVDRMPLGDRGFPWIFIGRDRAYRVDVISIARLMRGEQPETDHIVERTETSKRAEEVLGERPRMIGVGDRVPAGTITNTQARDRQRIEIPPTPRLAGANLVINHLRQLTASPILSPA